MPVRGRLARPRMMAPAYIVRSSESHQPSIHPDDVELRIWSLATTFERVLDTPKWDGSLTVIRLSELISVGTVKTCVRGSTNDVAHVCSAGACETARRGAFLGFVQRRGRRTPLVHTSLPPLGQTRRCRIEGGAGGRSRPRRPGAAAALTRSATGLLRPWTAGALAQRTSRGSIEDEPMGSDPQQSSCEPPVHHHV